MSTEAVHWPTLETGALALSPMSADVVGWSHMRLGLPMASSDSVDFQTKHSHIPGVGYV
jgi:hypothetical protein